MDPMDEDNAGPGPGNIQYGQINNMNTADLLQAGIEAGNIYRQTAGDVEVMELPEVCFIDILPVNVLGYDAIY